MGRPHHIKIQSFIDMLKNARMGWPYSNDEQIMLEVSRDDEQGQTIIRNMTDEFGFVFDSTTGQLLFCYNWKE